MRPKLIVIFCICLSLILCASPQKKLQEARKKDPRYQYNMGLFYLNNGEIDKAIEHLKKSLDLNPRYYLSLSSLGLAYSMKGNFQQSIKYFNECLKINPTFTEAHNYLGTVYQELGLLDNAAEEFRKALSDESYRSRELPYYNLARLYFLQDKLDEALDYIEKSIEINDRMHMAYNLKGIILEKLSNLEEAIISYKQALKIVPDEVNYNFNLAVAYFKNNEFSNAKEIFEKISPKVSDSEMKGKIDQYLKIMKK